MRRLSAIFLALALLAPALASGEEPVRPPQPGDWVVFDSYTEFSEGGRENEPAQRYVLASIKNDAWLVVFDEESSPESVLEKDAACRRAGKSVLPVNNGQPMIAAYLAGLFSLQAAEAKMEKIDVVEEDLETPAGVFSCFKETYTVLLPMPPEGLFNAEGTVRVWTCPELPFPGFARLDIDLFGNRVQQLREKGQGQPPARAALAEMPFITDSMRWD